MSKLSTVASGGQNVNKHVGQHESLALQNKTTERQAKFSLPCIQARNLTGEKASVILYFK